MMQVGQHYPAPQSEQHQLQQQQFSSAVLNEPYSTLYTASGQPVKIAGFNPEDGTCTNYRPKPARNLGILQIILGSLIFISQAVLTAMSIIGHAGLSGFWASIFFICAGALGVSSSKSMSRGTIIATMVLSIFSAIFSISVIVQGSVGVTIQSVIQSDVQQVGIAFHAMMLIMGLVENVVAIVAAAYCCGACCTGFRPVVVVNQTPVGTASIPRASEPIPVSAAHFHNNPERYPPPVATDYSMDYLTPTSTHRANAYQHPVSTHNHPHLALNGDTLYDEAGSSPEYSEIH